MHYEHTKHIWVRLRACREIKLLQLVTATNVIRDRGNDVRVLTYKWLQLLRTYMLHTTNFFKFEGLSVAIYYY